ncbi:hypothetical protein DPMN_155131 [Dreissena polymorpha]|uniref:Uncharacterized protein n=1 Tax=Dreissena polymorpha TaxID=45954 RepID=A0A9D4FS34_DREPO|nr:hypothetical protein DPMN_155131 [Dreissena polymorpha]
MARQRPTRLVMGPCIAEIDRIVIREVHHQLEVNWCRNEEVIQGAPGLVIVPCIVEIDRIVIREVQYQFEVNRCRNEEIIVKGNFGRVWSMWAGPIEIDRIVIREVQYQFEVNRCRNEEIIVKGNFGWVWSMWAGRPRIDCIVIREVQYQFEVNLCRNEEIIVKAILGGCGLVMGPCIVEIDPNVIREVQYQFEVNPCRNEKIIVNGIFWWVWPMWAGAPGLGLGPCIVEIDPNVITKVQYQFEVNPCRNEKIIVNGNFWWVWPMWAGRPRIDRIVIREVQYQFKVNRCRNKEVNFQGSSAFSVGGDSGQDGRTDRRTDGGDNHNIPTFFSKSVGITTLSTSEVSDRFTHTVFMHEGNNIQKVQSACLISSVTTYKKQPNTELRYDTGKGTSRAVAGENIQKPRGACVGAGATEFMYDNGKATSKAVTAATLADITCQVYNKPFYFNIDDRNGNGFVHQHEKFFIDVAAYYKRGNLGP